MAMKDLKSFTVAPEDEEKTVHLWMSFGWELKSTQEVKTQDTQTLIGQDSDGTEHYEIKEGDHYIKLTFERDPERKNYAELKSLEGQYDSVKDPYSPMQPTRFGCLWLVLSAIGLLLFVLPGVAIIVWRFIRYSKKKKIWNEEYAVYSKELDVAKRRRQELLQKAQSLV